MTSLILTNVGIYCISEIYNYLYSNNNNNKINEEEKNDVKNKVKNINIENQKFIKLFSEFYNKYKFIFDQKEIKLGFFGSLFNKKIPLYIDSSIGKMVNYAIYNLKLVPVVYRKISSFEVTIIIDGSISDNIIFHSYIIGS